jgi:phosphate transport system substrate-binding protein
MMLAIVLTLLTTTAAKPVAVPAQTQSLEIRTSRPTAALASFVAEAYMKEHPEVTVVVSPCQSCGLKSLILGLCDLALWADDGLEDEIQELADAHHVKLQATGIYLDGIVPVVHATNPVQNLTLKQLRDIFSGKITNWKDVGGNDAPILVKTWPSTTSTFEVFKRHVLGDDAVITPAAKEPEGGPRWHNDFDINGIGYVGMMGVKSLKALAVDGVTATAETVRSGKYIIVRHQAVYQRVPSTPLAAAVVDTFLAADQGQSFVKKAGNVPVR